MADPDVQIYAVGLCYASACAGADIDREQVERAVNYRYPTGVGPWHIADEPFATGQPNPCPCNDVPNRQHWLLCC
jgi:hypothetical protein